MNVGDVIEYKIKTKNISGVGTTGNNIAISDALPTDLTYQAGSLIWVDASSATHQLSDNNVKGQTITVTGLGSLTGGQSLTLIFKAKLAMSVTGTIKNVAVITGTVPGEPGEPEVPVTPVPVKNDESTPSGSPPTNTNNQNKLPKTGDSNSILYSVYGLLAVIVAGGALLRSSKKKNNINS